MHQPAKSIVTPVIAVDVHYISYYSMSNGDTNRAAKVAKLAKPLIPVTGNATITSANASGVADDGELFTGNWEGGNCHYLGAYNRLQQLTISLEATNNFVYCNY